MKRNTGEEECRWRDSRVMKEKRKRAGKKGVSANHSLLSYSCIHVYVWSYPVTAFHSFPSSLPSLCLLPLLTLLPPPSSLLPPPSPPSSPSPLFYDLSQRHARKWIHSPQRNTPSYPRCGRHYATWGPCARDSTRK